MRFAYTIIYVPDVSASLAFFQSAFGFQPRFVHESGTYGELETGATALAFAAHELAENLTLTLSVNNLFNTLGYTEINDGRMAARSINGRSAKVGLKYQF